jgi:DNA topoisomerase IA
MRTDSKTYSKDFIESAKKYIESGYGANYINKDIDRLAPGEREEERVADKTKEKKEIQREMETDDFMQRKGRGNQEI